MSGNDENDFGPILIVEAGWWRGLPATDDPFGTDIVDGDEVFEELAVVSQSANILEQAACIRVVVGSIKIFDISRRRSARRRHDV